MIKLVIGGKIIYASSVYAPKVGLDEKIKTSLGGH